MNSRSEFSVQVSHQRHSWCLIHFVSWNLRLPTHKSFPESAAMQTLGLPQRGVHHTGDYSCSPLRQCLTDSFSQTVIHPAEDWRLEMPQMSSSRPQPHHWIKFLDPWVHNFLSVLCWGLAPCREKKSSSRYQHRLKLGLPVFPTGLSRFCTPSARSTSVLQTLCQCGTVLCCGETRIDRKSSNIWTVSALAGRANISCH